VVQSRRDLNARRISEPWLFEYLVMIKEAVTTRTFFNDHILSRSEIISRSSARQIFSGSRRLRGLSQT
jgi:hypothetical protein